MTLVRDIRDLADHSFWSRAAHTRFIEAAPAGRSLTIPPLFMLGPATDEVTWELAGQIDTPQIGCYVLEDAFVAPTGIAIQNGVAFHGSAFIHPRHHVVAVSDRLNHERLPVRSITGPVAVIDGPANETYGHWLVDFLPRLWVLAACGYAVPSLQFLIPNDLPAFARALLELCGIGPNQWIIYDHWQELIRAETLLMPSGLRLGNRLAPCFGEATRFWTALARLFSQKRGHARIFLSRAEAPQARQLQNRARVEAIAQMRGYEIVRPETLSLAEQASLFSRAAIIVGEYGSALHNSVFSAPGTRVCGLRGNARHPSFIQSGIATAIGQQAAYLFGSTDGQDADQRFSVNEGLFHRALDLLEL